MGFTLFNSLSKKKEPMIPLEEGKVKLYTCGPTVYNFVHIGNLRTFLFEDLLVRYLSARGYDVTQVMNLTDVDDKTIRGCLQEKISLNEYTERYKQAFFQDIQTLNILPARFYPAATDHISEMVELVKTLIKKGMAYEASDGSIYFSIARFESYGQLSGMKKEDLKDGASGRIAQDEYSKEEARDFVLWKAWDEKDGNVFWETELGKGRPGWHLECSAMSMKYLGESFDIHCGGIDNLFPHHENEIAQSEAATGKIFVKYWMHSAFLTIQNEKMAKSKKNFYTLRDLLEKGFSPAAIRYALLTTHYRQPLNFSEELIGQSQSAIERVQDFLSRIRAMTREIGDCRAEALTAEAREGFFSHLDDDLNISPALAAFYDWIRKINSVYDLLGKNQQQGILDFLQEVNSVLGVFDLREELMDHEISKLIEERNEARDQKNFKRSDEIRDELLKKGIRLKDGKEGTRWERI